MRPWCRLYCWTLALALCVCSKLVSRQGLGFGIDKLIVDPILARTLVKGSRYIIPGDYVVSEEYGVGLFKGQYLVDLTPTRQERQYQEAIVIEFEDAEIISFKKMADKEYWLYRQSEAGYQELSSIVNRQKWNRRKKTANENSYSMALNLLKMQAIRNSFHRPPCVSVANQKKYIDFENRFTYEPTEDQVNSIEAIKYDMIVNTRPMERLVCGDVGFGKTEVAMRAIYIAVMSNRQVALLAPTRILALQHLRVLKNRMPEVNIQLLRGGNKNNAMNIHNDLQNGNIQVIVGTHALLQPNITWHNLGLIVIDEEQRFGVIQKEKLKAVQTGIDVLTLSATPIPRTMQMSISGLKDFSQINSPPKGRKEVTVHVGLVEKEIIMNAISLEVKRNGQVFVVVPFIRDIPSVMATLKDWLPAVSVLDAHGEHVDLEERIDSFTRRESQVLVATTVIENGIDMPNVNTIIVFQADRFGMSALYQLRGRVGRSTIQAHAYFLTNKTSITIEAETRLNYLKTFTALGSGYDLSRRDMEMRGYGSIFGSEQSGSKDVGLDFQAEILTQAVERLKGEYIVACPDCRLALNSSIEIFGVSKFGIIPRSGDSSNLCRWESSLAAALIEHFIADPRQREEALRDFQSAGTIKSLLKLSKEWSKKCYHPALSIELVKRAAVRVACRSLGIEDVIVVTDNDGGCIVQMLSTNINEAKYNSILMPVTPVTCVKDVAYHRDKIDDIELGVISYNNIKVQLGGPMPSELLPLLTPWSFHATKIINNAVKGIETVATEVKTEEQNKNVTM